MLSFTLLGQTVLSKNGVPLTRFRSQKEAALLIYLAHTGETHQRTFLADLLWESSSTKQSLTNLRTVLSRLRKRAGDALLVTRKSVAVTPENRQQVDSVALLQALNNIGQIDTAEKATTLQNALNTYRGDFLADFQMSDAPRFDEWVTTTREHIRRQVIAAYNKLGQYWLSANSTENGIAAAGRWLQVDALDEAAHTLLIQLLLESGNMREAVGHYEQCIELLHKELDVAPPKKMTALIKNAQAKHAVAARPKTAVRHNLSPAYDQFFGRKSAQQETHVRLDQPWCRLVTITGQGGVGKTRLATTIARSRLSQHRDGVWLVELENIDPDDENLAEAIAVEIATILDLRLTGTAAPAQQLLDHLQHKQMMLVLDNFEHLLAGIQIILDIVQRCEQVQLIVTSREALRLRAEWTITLTGLSYSSSDADEMPSEAVALFAARRAQQQRGEISADELTAIRTICSMVAGLPLAIELAAALTRQTRVQAVADSLRDGFDALKASLRDVPQRHRGLHIVFDMSWRTLSPALQQRLARLTVFRGGFTETAAQQIAEAETEHLATLSKKSLLIHHAETNRYTLHPVIRAYAAEKREQTDPTPQKHASYFLTLLAQHTESLQKERPQDSIIALEPDIDNMRRAWQTGLAERHVELLYDALTSLSIYYQLRGLAREGEAVMLTTQRTATAWDTEGIALAARAGLEQARFQNRLGQHRSAIQTIKAALRLASEGADRWAEAMGHVWWGEALWRHGKYDLARNKLQHALNIGHAIDSSFVIGWCHHQLGIIDDIQSRYAAALKHLGEACTMWRKLENVRTLSVSLNSVGLVYYHQGDLPAAQQAMEQALTLCNQIEYRHLQAHLLNNLSNISSAQGDHMGAQYYLQLGLALATTNGNLTGQGEIYTNLGRIYRLQGEIELAVENLEQGFQIAKSTGNRALMATIMINLAKARLEQGDLKKAETFYAQALKIAQQGSLQGTECEVLLGMAELFGQKDEKRARQYSTQAIELAEVIQNPSLLERANAINQHLHTSVKVYNKKNLSE